MKSFISKIFHLPVFVHLLAVIGVSFIVIYIVLKYLDFYTSHNQAVRVPDIIGLQVEDAKPFLEQYMLFPVVIDSIYADDVPRGAIVDLMPEANSKVKRNRIIYLKINAKTEKMVTVPDVKDISYREAYARLRSKGFDIETKWVPGEFRELAIGVEHNGLLIDSGARVPISSKLFLIVTNGTIEPLEGDTINSGNINKIGGNESWF